MKCFQIMLFLYVSSLSIPASALFGAGDVVFDPTNLAQNIKEVLTAKQQLDDMLQNTQQLTQFNWDNAQGIVSQLLNLTNTIDYYKNQLGSINKYLGQFQDIDYYRFLPCVGGNACTPSDRAKIAESNRLGSEARKKANDALFRGIDQQQQTLQKDADHLKTLQKSAQSSTGRLQVLQAANELASEQANQLLQIRGLLVAQQNALATQMQVQNDKESRAMALEEKFKSGSYNSAKEVGY